MSALSKPDEPVLNPLVQAQSGTFPGTPWNTDLDNQEPNVDRSQIDPHLEVGSSVYRSDQSVDSDPKEAPHMMTGFQEEISYCSPGISPGKQKKARSTCQLQFHSKTPLRELKQSRICWSSTAGEQ